MRGIFGCLIAGAATIVMAAALIGAPAAAETLAQLSPSQKFGVNPQKGGGGGASGGGAAVGGGLVVDQRGGGDYVSVQEAVAAAPAGARIVIRPGRYFGGLIINKPLELIGDGPRESITLETNGEELVLWEAPTGRIQGLTLINSSIRPPDGENWSAIYITSGRPVIEDNVLISSDHSTVVVNRQGTRAIIRNNVLRDAAGGSVLIANDSSAVVENNVIVNSAYAGVMVGRGASAEIRGNTFRDGQSTAILLYDDGRAVIENNRVENHPPGNAGFTIERRADADVSNNVITGNGGMGVWVRSGAQVRLFGNDLRGNREGSIVIDPDAGQVDQRDNLTD